MSCKKNKKKAPPAMQSHSHSRKCCDEMVLPLVEDLTTTPTPVLMINTGDGFSPVRQLAIEAEVSPTQTTGAETTATFQLAIDGEPVGAPVEVVLDDVDGLPPGERQSIVLRFTANVEAGAHLVTLIASSDQPADLNPTDGGARLTVCSSA